MHPKPIMLLLLLPVPVPLNSGGLGAIEGTGLNATEENNCLRELTCLLLIFSTFSLNLSLFV